MGRKTQAIAARTGNILKNWHIHAMSPLVKLVWMRNEYPEFFEVTAKFISIKEYVFYQLFQEDIIDYLIASATGLLNLKLRTWDKRPLQNRNLC